ncbi:FecR domain-containing protein [Stutzerimonas kirkiae]|uniref:Iron dicitrate transport regulator FecR n=1 Tax=Stutzerimonas kirkiae TaxID=2211392 RepID=A0A4V2KCU1_9GAMM|nr:FecR domain-containing protein [Stutzerimonas kirkiae]TBU96306.1 iron dicitrate transport regulator FecR [Stutzerimonas kirkiae]TBV03423.1 iron dicitrate transport regulator FecR [Stutzerimonas kirkiae]TBV05878.1 iron dicitrate transport regulator FecR [Stutzerimonas kirkiae]TBV12945.1 iron dicitrate transport regulator FecR [Stutzerimonas kirkiae]
MDISEQERAAIRAAAVWYARLSSGAASQAEEAEWASWHAADPLHQQAWQRIQAVREQVERVPGRIARATLQQRAAYPSRRELLGFVVLLGGAGWLGWRSDYRQAWQADYRSAVGQRQSHRLADGSSLMLNTDTALDVHFDPQQRLLRLLRGEILVETAADGLQRPFLVETPHGRVQALGTRFTVRCGEQGSEVAVLQRAVLVTTAQGDVQRVAEGQTSRFDGQGISPVENNAPGVAAWQQGSLVVVDRPLHAVLAELSRYRHGILRCDPAIAALNVSGAFPIDDTDLALAALESGLGLQAVRRTRYWVTLTRAPG